MAPAFGRCRAWLSLLTRLWAACQAAAGWQPALHASAGVGERQVLAGGFAGSLYAIHFAIGISQQRFRRRAVFWVAGDADAQAHAFLTAQLAASKPDETV